MNPVQFGVFLAPAAGDVRGIADRARTAERAGFDYVSIQFVPERETAEQIQRFGETVIPLVRGSIA